MASLNALSPRPGLRPASQTQHGYLNLFFRCLQMAYAAQAIHWLACWALLSHTAAALAEGQAWSPRPGIVGRDDRKPLDSAAWPWRALGRVNQADGNHCTGALIAADAVLTAAHCLMDRGGGWLAPEDLVFVAGQRQGADLGEARGRAILHPAHPVNPRRPALRDIGDDWAVLYLDHPLAVRPIPIRPLPVGGDGGKRPAAHLMLAGYSQEQPHRLSLHDGCGVVERVDGDRVLLTDCDSAHGDSGSPLLAKQGGKVWIVGVASAIVVRGTRPGSFAVSANAFAGQTAGLK